MALDLVKIGALAAKLGLSLAGNTRVDVVITMGRQGQAAELDVETDTLKADPAATTTDPIKALKYVKKASQQPRLQLADGTTVQYSHTYAIEGAALAAGKEIKPDDSIAEGGTNWVVIEARIDPANALWLVDVRR